VSHTSIAMSVLEPTPARRNRVVRAEIPVLTSARAVAALEVVLLHVLFELGGPWAASLPHRLTLALTYGHVSVSFFFVLSGFILTYTYTTEDGGLSCSQRQFWRARFARIYPLYILSFLLDVPRTVSLFLGKDAKAIALAKIATSGAGYVTLLQSWFPRITNTWNTPGWSLSTEAFFYLLFPALIVTTKRWSPRRFAYVALLAWACPVALDVGIDFLGGMPSSSTIETLRRSFPPLRLPEFALGIAAARFHFSGELAENRAMLRALALGASILTLTLLLADFEPLRGTVQNSLEAPLFAVMILGLASSALRAPRIFRSPALVLLGRASYAAYIIHQPFKFWFLWLQTRIVRLPPSPALLATYVVTLELVSIALYLKFEDPARRLILSKVAAPAVVRTST